MHSPLGQRYPLAFVVCAALLAGAAALAPAPPSEAARLSPDAASDATAALEAGRAQLRLNRADEALPQLQSAIRLFTQANDPAGAASARDAVGDIYQRQGQHAVALENYEAAYNVFCARRDAANADVLAVKIGETHYLAGDAAAAGAAFARVGRCGTKDASDGNGNGGAGGVAFLPAGAAASLGACSALSPNSPANNPPGNPTTGPLQNAGPTLGRPPTPRSRSVRMDLRVVDQNGNPVGNARAKLWSERQPNGFLCECEHFTNAQGSVLMDPIHYTKTLTLEVEAKGFEALKAAVDPYSLGKPFQAVLQAKGAAAAAQSASQSAAQQAARAASSAFACADLYRLFVARGFGAVGAARSDYESGRLDDARRRYEGLLAASAENSPAGSLQAARLFRAVARTSLGDIAFKEGRFAEAARLYQQAADGARKDNRLELAWAAQRGLGRSLWAQASASAADAAQKRADALDAYRAAITTVEKLYAGSIRADEARTNFLASTRDLYEEAAAAFAESALSDAAPAAPAAFRVSAHADAAAGQLTRRGAAYAADAFRVAEQGRARSLLDLIGDSRAQITGGLPAPLVASRLANRARQNEIVEQLRGVRGATALNARQQQSVAELETELERLAREYDEIENKLRTGSARYRAHLSPLTLAEVQQQVLDDNTALLSYTLGRERSYLFAVTRTGVSVFRLPARAEVERQVEQLRARLLPPGSRRAIAGEPARVAAEDREAAQTLRGLVLGGAPTETAGAAEYAAAANTLYRAVVAPAAAVFGTRRLLVAPDGALNYVPFEALVTAPGGADYSSLAYLVRTNEIVYAPSASVVAAVRQRPRATAGGVLVVADPVFDPSDERARGHLHHSKDAPAQFAAMQSAIRDVAGTKLTNFRLVRLAGTKAEAERIADLARAGGGSADVWLDLEASEGNVSTRRLEGYRVLHIATHGLLDAERPQFTGLALSLVGDPEADGFLRVEEVFNLRLGSPLVVLSACETGLGREKRGEGVIGLTRAFMYAGAPTVGVSLWAVADNSTAVLMPEFYKRLLASGGREPAAAMRAAQQQMIAGRRFSAPFYWAPFVLVGDWR
jgi:CHAT domain-containing protein